MNLHAANSVLSTEQTQQQQKMITPTEIDILCGRGRTFAKHPGNKIFNQAVHHNLQNYADAPKRIDKSIVVASVVSSLLDQGTRFLKQDKKSKNYYVLSSEQIHGKTGHAIRDILKNMDPPSHKTTPFSRALPESVFSFDHSTTINAAINQKELKSLFDGFDFEPLPINSLSRNQSLIPALNISESRIRVEEDDKMTATPDEAILDAFGREGDFLGHDSVAPLPLSSEVSLGLSDIILNSLFSSLNYVPENRHTRLD
jgi:hypothetical protein